MRFLFAILDYGRMLFNLLAMHYEELDIPSAKPDREPEIGVQLAEFIGDVLVAIAHIRLVWQQDIRQCVGRIAVGSVMNVASP